MLSKKYKQKLQRLKAWILTKNTDGSLHTMGCAMYTKLCGFCHLAGLKTFLVLYYRYVVTEWESFEHF